MKHYADLPMDLADASLVLRKPFRNLLQLDA